MKWITAAHIANWANTQQRHCQQTLPELVGRLILAHTANDVSEFDFPNGDSIATGGWDGRLKTPVTFPYFPNGASGWEIGTEKTAETKANGDYTKRVTDPLGMVQADTTFVFVTPRSFTKRNAWMTAKKALGDWKDVKLIVKTDGTYDCSASLAIHSIGYQKILPQTGETEIDIGTPKAGEPLQGVCGMGMYSFVINFS